MIRTTALCVLTAFVVYWFSISVSMVGETTKMKPGETFGWSVPITILLLTIIPALLGYIAGKSDEVKK